MRLIDADEIVFDYSGLAYISPYDGMAIAKYFADQIKAMPTIIPPPNAPLTLEELREMAGEPVYIVEGTYSYYALISGVLDRVVWLISRWDEREMLTDDYGKTWLAYRRKPEEGTT